MVYSYELGQKSQGIVARKMGMIRVCILFW